MKHALVIEDQYLIAMMLGDELGRFGYSTVDIAGSEEDAIRLARENCPDLITVDDRLGQGSGLAAVRRICRDRAIPVVFITTEPERIAEAAPDAVVIEKPLLLGALPPAIDAACETARIWA